MLVSGRSGTREWITNWVRWVQMGFGLAPSPQWFGTWAKHALFALFPAPFIYPNVAHDKLCIESRRESAPTGSQLVCDGSAAELFVSEVVEDWRRVWRKVQIKKNRKHRQKSDFRFIYLFYIGHEAKCGTWEIRRKFGDAAAWWCTICPVSHYPAL